MYTGKPPLAMVNAICFAAVHSLALVAAPAWGCWLGVQCPPSGHQHRRLRAGSGLEARPADQVVASLLLAADMDAQPRCTAGAGSFHWRSGRNGAADLGATTALTTPSRRMIATECAGGISTLASGRSYPAQSSVWPASSSARRHSGFDGPRADAVSVISSGS